jgi:hypothetical protein
MKRMHPVKTAHCGLEAGPSRRRRAFDGRAGAALLRLAHLSAATVGLAMASGAEQVSAGRPDQHYAFALPPVREAVLLSDFSGDLPSPGGEEALGLRFRAIRPTDSGRGGDVHVVLRRKGNQWAGEGHAAAADYNQKSANQIEIKELTLAGDRLSGSLAVTIGPDAPPPGSKAKGFPTPADAFQIQLSAERQPGKVLPWQETFDAFTPWWRNDTPRFGGELFVGSYKAAWNGREVSGELVGGLNPLPARGVFGCRGNIHFAKAAGGGIEITAHLAPKRVASPESAMVLKEFAEPADWRRFDGLRIAVESGKKRDFLGVAVWLREASGAWYSVTQAGPLLGREATAVIPLSDFRRTSGFDASYFLDLDRIAAIGIGVEDPRGVGDVTFTVRKIELVRWGEGAGAPPAAPVNLAVDLQSNLDIGGTSEIPKGLFGWHDDRGRDTPKPPGWAPEDMSDPIRLMRDFNPGYLRYLVHAGGFGGKEISDEEIKAIRAERLQSRDQPTNTWYRRAEAGGALDQTIVCHTAGFMTRPAWMDQDPKTAIEGVRLAYRNWAARAWTPGDDFNHLRRFEFWNEPFLWGRHINQGAQTPPGKKDWQDPTQFGYLPGKLGADVYSDHFLAAVEGAKSANPHVFLGGPSAPALLTDDYSAFDNYVRHFLDRCHDRIDFLTEHHYQGQPDAFAASYEVAAAYMDVNYNRRLPIYNTECNDMVDAPTKGDDGQPAGPTNAVHLNRAHYHIQDILSCLRVSPDICKGRAVYGLFYGYPAKKGEADAYLLMAPLRGKMLPVTSSDEAILFAASSPAAGRLALLAMNNSPHTRQVVLPLGDEFTVESDRRLEFDEGTRLMAAPAAAGKISKIEVSLPPRVARCWVLAKDGYGPSRTARIEKFYLDRLMLRVGSERPETAKVVWRGRSAAGAQAAWLRVISRGVDRGEAVAVVGGQSLPLPWSSSTDECAAAQDIALDPALLKDTMAVEFRCTDAAASNGFTVYAAAVLARLP